MCLDNELCLSIISIIILSCHVSVCIGMLGWDFLEKWRPDGICNVFKSFGNHPLRNGPSYERKTVTSSSGRVIYFLFICIFVCISCIFVAFFLLGSNVWIWIHWHNSNENRSKIKVPGRMMVFLDRYLWSVPCISNCANFEGLNHHPLDFMHPIISSISRSI